MPEYNFQLRGCHALVGVALLIGFFGVKMYLRIRPVDDAMRDAVREELLSEYSGRCPKDVARLVTQARQGTPVDRCLRSFSTTWSSARFMRVARWEVQ